MLVCLLFIGSIAAVGYVSLLLPDKLVLTRSLLIIAGGVTAAAGLILCAVSGRGEGRAALIFFGAAIAVGCVIGSLYFGDYRNRIVQRFSGSDRSVTAVVGRVRYSSASYMIFDAQLSSIDGESCSLSATVKVRGAPGLRVGERFGMHADIAETEPYDGTALSLMYSASEGRFLTLSTDSLSIYGREPSGSLTARFARLRERVGQTLSLRLGDGAGLCRALLLGDRSELGDSISDDFSALGISHIVAVSGLHTRNNHCGSLISAAPSACPECALNNRYGGIRAAVCRAYRLFLIGSPLGTYAYDSEQRKNGREIGAYADLACIGCCAHYTVSPVRGA